MREAWFVVEVFVLLHVLHAIANTKDALRDQVLFLILYGVLALTFVLT